jgi:hypothetical protein
MRNARIYPLFFIIFLYFLFNPLFGQKSKLINLLPKIKGWKSVELPQIFTPTNLYEYINGGAEIYLAYDFRELVVAEFKNQKNASIVIEIYDMGDEKNCFGIYSIERSPDSNYLEIGNHGYIDGESLNFIISTYYIKINCYDCGENTRDNLLNFADGIINKIENRGSLPPILFYFPEKGLIKNSEKFYLKNFLGMDFLKNGYKAEYNLNNENFSLFIVEGEDEQGAQEMFNKLKNNLKDNLIGKIRINDGECYIAKDKYYKKILMMKSKNYIFGSLKLEDMELAKDFLLSILLKIRGEK